MKNKIKIDFPLALKRPIVDKDPRRYYLTINAILKKNDNNGDIEKVVRLQKEVLDGVEAQKLVGSGIYEYPSDDIHFSIINFGGLISAIDNEEEFEIKREVHIDKIKLLMEEFNQDQKNKVQDKTVEFSYIYTKSSQSIAIQAFPSGDLCKFFENLSEKFNNEKILKPTNIKKNEHKYCNSTRFAVNILRFFRELSDEEYNKIARNVLEINKRSNDQNILFEMDLKRISLVVSDNWLSNDNPEKFFVNLK